MFDEKRIEDDNLDNNVIHNNNNNRNICNDFNDKKLKHPHKSNDVDHYLYQNEKHPNTYHNDMNTSSAIVSNEKEDIKMNITPMAQTKSNFKEEEEESTTITTMSVTTSESLSPPHTIDSVNCLNINDELQQMIDDEMENIDSDVYASAMSSVSSATLPRFSLISSTIVVPTTTTTTIIKTFEMNEDSLDNL